MFILANAQAEVKLTIKPNKAGSAEMSREFDTKEQAEAMLCKTSKKRNWYKIERAETGLPCIESSIDLETGETTQVTNHYSTISFTYEILDITEAKAQEASDKLANKSELATIRGLLKDVQDLAVKRILKRILLDRYGKK